MEDRVRRKIIVYIATCGLEQVQPQAAREDSGPAFIRTEVHRCPANRRARPALKPTVSLFIRIGRVLLSARRRVPALPPFEIIAEHVSGAVEEG